MTRSRLPRIIAAAVAVAVIVVGTSATRYVLAHPNDPLQQSLASWARNKGMGAVVDRLEAWLHNDPPATAPVDTLALVVDDTTLDSTVPTDTSVPGPSTTAPVSTPSSGPTPSTSPATTGPATQTSTESCASRSGSSTTTSTSTSTTTSSTSTTTTSSTSTSTTVPESTTTTTSTIPTKPIDVMPVIEPAIKGEGRWATLVKVRKQPIVFATSIRPLWCYGSVVATAAAFDPNRVHMGLFNGTEVPGGKGWVNGSRIGRAALPSLLASFNGGFRFEHKPGGYMTEGRMIKPMRDGYATMAIRKDGYATIGIWGKDIKDDGSWASLRQNLPPLVLKGRAVYKKFSSVDWGQDYDNKIFNFRSAVCLRNDGHMMFIAVGNVNIAMLADSMIVLGCRIGMELDVNGTWPFFATYSSFGSSTRWGRTLDTRMGDPNRHLSRATKDFFALFDPETLRKGAVR